MEKETTFDVSNTKIVRNFPFPNLKSLTIANIESAMDFKHRDGDIVVCSYPKTGTTWLEYIVLQILHKGDSFPSFFDLTHKVVPFIELTGIEPVEKLAAPCFYKTHIPYNLLNSNPKAKYLYVYRDPKDTLVSYYHFRIGITGEYFDFDEFYEKFLQGDVGYGNYFDHVLSFHSHKNDPNVLMVSYEDLTFSWREQVLRIAEFLGDQYHQMLLQDEPLLQKILAVTSFQNLKKHITKNSSGTMENGVDENSRQSAVRFDRLKSSLCRNGIIGDGEKLLTQIQVNKLNAAMLDKMAGTEFVDLWGKSSNVGV